MKKTVYALLCVLFASQNIFAQTSATVKADFSTWEEYPLVKKIGVYQTPLVTRAWLQRDMYKMAEIEARSFRYEFAWGKDLYTSADITGTTSDLKYNWANANYLFSRVSKHSPAIIFCHGYMPLPLQDGTGGLAWQKPPQDYNLWQTVNKVAAENWREKGYSNRYVEIWNEPDLPGGFFSGSVDDYVRVYQYGALGAKEGDPDAKVGGPGGALQWWHEPLVNHCLANNLPLDFVSGHAYGIDFTWQLNAMRNALNRLGNRSAEMLLTEYSPYAAVDYAANGPVERAEAAMTFFQAIPTILQYTDLSYVTWAQYIDPMAGTSGKAFSDWDKLGLIDGNYGFRKSLFNAFKLYGMMPEDRCAVELPSGTPLGSLASTSDDCSTLVIWNPSDNDYVVQATLRKLPFKEGRLQMYNIDETTNSWYETGDDRLIPFFDRDTVASALGNNPGSLTLKKLSLRPKGVLFIRFQAHDAKPLYPQNDFADIVRTDQWYESVRDNNNPYAYFDSKTWTAHLSTCNRANGTAVMSVTAENLPQNILVKSKFNTLTDRNANSQQAIRIDFQSNSGNYTSSVLFHGGIYHSDQPLSLPWGTTRAPSRVVKVDDMKNFSFRLSDYAPSSFSGRAIITFILAQTGANTKCNFQLMKQDDLMLDNVRAESVEPNSMDVSVRMDGSVSDVVKTGFMSSNTNDPLAIKARVVEAETEGNSFRLTLKGLTANKPYQVRGLAIRSNGDTIYTPVALFQTPARPSSITLYDVDCDTVARKASLRANIKSSPTTVYKRGFVWSEAESSPMPGFQDNVVMMSTTGTGVYTTELSNLSPATVYAVRAFTFSGAGTTFSEPKYFSTNPYITAISELPSDGVVPVAYYDLCGRRVSSSEQTGVTIVHYSDGSTRKVLMK